MAYFKSNKVEIKIANILKGTSDPVSSIGDNGQLYLKYGSYEKHYFMDNKIVVVENKDDATDLKLYVVGLTKDTSGIPITDPDLIAYLSDITNGYLKGCSSYDTADSTTKTGILAIADFGDGLVLHTYILGWTQYKAGTFYAVLDLTQAPVVASVSPPYQDNPYVDPDTFIDKGILDSFAKINGQWQNLIGTTIDDILAGGSKYIKTTGSFTSASSGGQKVEVNCGFKPDLVMVDMEFGNGFTRATYLSTAWYEETDHPASVWDLRPMENVIYAIVPGSVNGETGITDLTDTGFKYRSNGSNTTNKACTYTAIKFDAEEVPEPDTSDLLFKDGEFYNTDKVELGIENGVVSDGTILFTTSSAVGGIYFNSSTLDGKFAIVIHYENDNQSVQVTMQYGTSKVGTSVVDVIGSGTDRYTYETRTINTGVGDAVMVRKETDDDTTIGVFFGNHIASAIWKVHEIYLIPC